MKTYKVDLRKVKPVNCTVLECTADRIVLQIPAEGGGILLSGTAGCVEGAQLSDYGWLWCDFYYPQEQMYATTVDVRFYREGQDPLTDAPRATVTTNAFPHYWTRLPYDFREITCKNAFLPRTPSKLKTTSSGVGITPEETAHIFLGARKSHRPQRFVFQNVTFSDAEPDYPLPDVKVVDELGQWARRNWPGKSRGVAEVVERLRREAAEPDPGPRPMFSRYGGWKEKNFGATGFFRTHYDGRRWWFVDPDGYAFLSIGLEFIFPEDSSVVTGWEKAYTWLPDRDGEFADAWKEVHGDPEMARRVGYCQVVSFPVINLIRAFGKDWKKAWCAITARRLHQWGINMVGNGEPARCPVQETCRFPYTAMMGEFPRTDRMIFRDFSDVFDPVFAQRAEACAQNLLRLKGDPYCIGYFLTNEPEWAYVNELCIAEKLVGHPDETLYTKAVFVDWMRERYHGDLEALNAAWGQGFTSFDQLKRPIPDACSLNDTVKADLEAFSYVMVTEFHKVPSLAARKVDPDHLNLGMRYAWIHNPVQVAGCEYFDVFDINCYDVDPVPQIELTGKLVNKPVMISEFHHGSIDAGLPLTGIKGVTNQEERGVAYRYYMEQAATSPYFLGAVHFVLNDQQILCNSGQENYNIGFVDCCQRPYDAMVAAATAVSENIYPIADGRQAPYDREPQGIPMIAT